MFVPILLLIVGCWFILVDILIEPYGNLWYKLLFKMFPRTLAVVCFVTAAQLFGWIGG